MHSGNFLELLKWECRRHPHINKVIDRLMQEMNNRFTDSFSHFDLKRLLRLAELNPDDFSSREKRELNEQLRLFLTFVKSSSEFSSLQTIGDLAKQMVETEWHTIYSLSRMICATRLEKNS
ncbi:unnamed protein product [Cuscuta europaea]|uniref:Uncharacterized protein n=1 Tax=Cuscuta europaea TaxID=41803 RepID=A0A9P0YTD0_CUSEU|nr:unnamed protein product [Cuscuta europaea]